MKESSILAIILGAIAAFSGGGWFWEAWKRKHPNALERATMQSANADIAKTYAEAKMVELSLGAQMQELIDQKVDEKVAALEEMMVRRELECSKQLANFIKRLAEEVAQKEDYWEQLKDARQEVAYWQGLYNELKGRHPDKY